MEYLRLNIALVTERRSAPDRWIYCGGVFPEER